VPVNVRLALSLVAYAVLGMLAWRTMDADKIRLVTFAILGLFAFRTIMHATRLKHERQQEQSAVDEEHSNESGSVEPSADCRVPSATQSRE
jgi:uncharacterized membrane protein YeiB